MKRTVDFYRKADWKREVLEKRPKGKLSESYRSESRIDYARLIHSPSFRRLQRKQQLFPANESDFFRNRITHSFEVAQVAKSIAIRINHLIQRKYESNGIDLDLIEFAGLAHDLGHPPFGHTGEMALDDEMKDFGGYEGNAQTLRILSRVEKKYTKNKNDNGSYVEFANNIDQRAGLNLSYRALASIIKYNREIPEHRIMSNELQKGYYTSEASLVSKIKQSVTGIRNYSGDFKTVEMQIMDIADDIAYSTYDLEDALKAGFTSPLDILTTVNGNEEIRQAVAEKLFRSKYSRSFPKENASEEDYKNIKSIKDQMEKSIWLMFANFFTDVTEYSYNQLISSARDDKSISLERMATFSSLAAHKHSNLIQSNGYYRTAFTSDLVGARIRAIEIDVNEEIPALSKIILSEDARFQMDALKHLTYEMHIRSQRLQVVETRGKQIVKELFEAFKNDTYGALLPQDWRNRLEGIRDNTNFSAMHMRLISDFIAGMTDKYALDVYERLKSSSPAALFRPL